jgi:hypothetical protein
MCGCHDTACATPMWQLQGIRPAGSGVSPSPSGNNTAGCPAAGDVKLLYPAEPGGTTFTLKDHDPNKDDDYYDNWDGATFTTMTENGVQFWRSTGAWGHYGSGLPNAIKHRIYVYPSGCRTAQKYGWQSGAAKHGYTCKPEDPPRSGSHCLLPSASRDLRYVSTNVYYRAGRI